MLEQVFPNEAELNILQSGAKKIGRAEVHARKKTFLEAFLSFVNETNYLKIIGLPEDLRETVQILMCERTYLIQLVKGLIEQVLHAKPKFFGDAFLENEYKNLQEKHP